MKTRKNIFGKLFALLSLSACIFTLGACQSANYDAYVDTSRTTCTILEDASTHEKYARTAVCIVNNTIYNITEYSLHIDCYNVTGEPVVNYDATVATYVSHGVEGFIIYDYKLQTPAEKLVTTVKFSQGKVTGYQNVWETYLGWWVAGIIVASLLIITYAAVIFSRRMTMEQLKDMLGENIGNTMVIFGLTLIICIFPIFFGSWVSALILIGTFIVSIIVSALLTLLKAAIIKKH